MQSNLITMEGIVLRAKQGREGGRSLFVFTKENGLMQLSVPRAVMQACGTGLLLSFSHIRFSAMLFSEYGVVRQYEGELLLDMMQMDYEKQQPWYYVIELALQVFPKNQSDYKVYQILQEAAMAAKERNQMVVAFLTAVKLLVRAGFDPTVEEAMQEGHLSKAARSLLLAFRNYRWKEPLGQSISSAAFRECALYLDSFILQACDVEMNMKGAFVR